MSKNSSSPGFRRLPRVADQMTPDLMACVTNTEAAERVGCVAEALEWHRAVPMFQRGRHCQMLTQLAQLGEDRPPWVDARWLVYQSLRCENAGSRAAEKLRAALTYATKSVHSDLLVDCFEDGGDPIRVTARVAAESWFFHQVLAYESGGLVCYLDEFIDPALFEHADLARRWTTVALDAYRVGASLPGSRLQVHDSITDDVVEILDLGARAGAGDGGWVVGRLVPSGLVEDLRVFDTPPLPVSEQIAVEVAAERGRQPWSPITSALAEGRLTHTALLREDHELLSDVKDLDMLRIGTPVRDLDRVTTQLREGRDEIGRAAFRVLRRAAEDDLDEVDAAVVAAAALNPYAHGEARRQLCGPGTHDAWVRWVERTPEPGRSRLRALALSTNVAA